MRSLSLRGMTLLSAALVGGAALAQGALEPSQLPALPAAIPVPAAAAAPVTSAPATPPAPAGDLPPLPATAASIFPSAAPLYSFGDANVSIFFLPEQVQKMKAALTAYEDERRRMGGGDEQVNLSGIDSTPVADPGTYPVFYLSSIVYRTAGDWTVWVSGHKITPLKNDTDLTVVGVSPEQVTFDWKPTYAEALAMRSKRGLFAPTDAIKNRLVPEAFHFDEPVGLIRFTLKANQSFAIGYFSMFEGYMDSPPLTPLTTAAQTPDGQAPGTASTAKSDSVPPLPAKTAR